MANRLGAVIRKAQQALREVETGGQQTSSTSDSGTNTFPLKRFKEVAQELQAEIEFSKSSDNDDSHAKRELRQAEGVLRQMKTVICCSVGGAPRSSQWRRNRTGADRGNGDKDTSEAVHSLLRTRNSLTNEVQRMESAVQKLIEGGESLKNVKDQLEEVDAQLSRTGRLLRQIARMDTIDDVVLRVSIALYLLLLGYIWSSRLFGAFAGVSIVETTDPAFCSYSA
jgi:transcription termination factor NusB